MDRPASEVWSPATLNLEHSVSTILVRSSVKGPFRPDLRVVVGNNGQIQHRIVWHTGGTSIFSAPFVIEMMRQIARPRVTVRANAFYDFKAIGALLAETRS